MTRTAAVLLCALLLLVQTAPAVSARTENPGPVLAAGVSEGTIPISGVQVSGLEAQINYTGAALEPGFSLSDQGTTLIRNEDYTVAYFDNLLPGHARILVTGIGAYTGELTLYFEIVISTSQQVADKVSQLLNECRAAEITDDYGTALWFHDWLVTHADYDTAFTEYGADGVLLKGTGVCQSYTLAYALLLDAARIENKMLGSPEMQHSWNLVKLNGAWCHVDCTWDDPQPGGKENHDYFGLNDELMARDHRWNQSEYPACTSLDNYYLVQQGHLLVRNEEELRSALSKKADEGQTRMECTYIGTEAGFNLGNAFLDWFWENNWRYGMESYTIHQTETSLQAEVTYKTPWSQPGMLTGVTAPDFVMEGPLGTYRSSNYAGRGRVMIFGSLNCSMTRSLMQELHGSLQDLYDAGVDVLMNVMYAETASDLSEMRQNFPNFHYTYGDSNLLWTYAHAIGIESRLSFPLVTVVDGNGTVTYCAMSYVSHLEQLLEAADAVGDGRTLPQPEPRDYSGTVQADLRNAGSSAMASKLLEISQQANGVYYIYDASINTEVAQQLARWEENSDCLERLGMKMAVCFQNYEGRTPEEYAAQYPHIRFLTDNGSALREILNLVDQESQQIYYRGSYLIDDQGMIFDYTNGSLLPLQKSMVKIAFRMSSSFALPSGLTRIGEESFAGTPISGRLDLRGTGVTEIARGAFADCDRMQVLVLPSAVTVIEQDAFTGCENLVLLCEDGSTAAAYAEAQGLLSLSY